MTTTRRVVLALVLASLPLPVLAQDVQNTALQERAYTSPIWYTPAR
jgi:hypothetical protein